MRRYTDRGRGHHALAASQDVKAGAASDSMVAFVLTLVVTSASAQQLSSQLNSGVSLSSSSLVEPVSRVVGTWDGLRETLSAVAGFRVGTWMQWGGPDSIMRPTSRHWKVKRNKNKSESILIEGGLLT